MRTALKINNFLFGIALVCLHYTGLAQPGWVDDKGAGYSGNTYVSGFDIATIDKDSNLDDVREKSVTNAKRDLTEKIKLSIQSSQKSTEGFNNSKVDGKLQSSYNEIFQSSVESISNVEVVGLESKEYNDKKLYYTLVYAPREKIYQEYKRNWDLINTDVKQTYDAALAKVSNSKFDAQKQLLTCFKKIDKRNELESVIYAIGYKVEWGPDIVTYKKVKSAIEGIRQTKITSVQDLSFAISSNLISQVKAVSGVIIKPLIYREPGAALSPGKNLPSPFSKYLRDYIETDLTANSQWAISQETAFSPRKKFGFVKGHYQQIGDELEFKIILQDPNEGIRASYRISVPLSVIQQTGLDYIPPVQDDFAAYKGLKPSGLKVDVWTNKGMEDLLYVEDEILKLGFKVNMPCYLRVVYYLADGSKVLFFDNFQVEANDVKNEVVYPEEFVCAEPFGVETLQVFAKTTPFEELNTQYEYGYTFIMDGKENIINKSRNTRGFTKKDYLAENRLTITTMAK